jgi:hypothetical protein
MNAILLSLLLLCSINCFANSPQPVTSAPVVTSAPAAANYAASAVTAHPVIHLSDSETIMIGIIMFMFVMFVVEHEEEPKKKRRH